MKKIISMLTVAMMLSMFGHPIEAKTDEEYLIEIQETVNLINELYVGDEVTKDELYESALKGIESMLDAYSGIYTQEEAMELVSTLNSDYVGIGVGVQMIDGEVYITQVFDGGDAKDKGVMINDQLIRVNGEDVKGQDLDSVVSKSKDQKRRRLILSCYVVNKQSY